MDSNEENFPAKKSFFESENVQKIVDEVSEVANNIMNKSPRENAETIKNVIVEKIESAKEIVEEVKNSAAGMKDNILNKSEELKENLENLKNSVTGKIIENVSSVTNAEKDFKKAIENSDCKNRIAMGFFNGPDKNSPPLDGSFISYVYLIKDLIWFYLLSFPIFFKTIWEKFNPPHEKDLKDKVVVVTGAGNGIGKELSIELAKQGCKVACVDIAYENNKETALSIMYASGRKDAARSYGCDVSNPEETKKLAQNILNDFGQVDILINNAGIVYGHEITGGSDSEIKKVIDVNLLSHFWMVRSFLPTMKENKSGHIVFINSLGGVNAVGNASSYSASKFGLLGLAYSLDDELRRNPEYDNIKISSVHPYFIATNPTFVKSLKLRLQPVELNVAVDKIITGIKREYFTFAVPHFHLGFLLGHLIRCLPLDLYRIFKNIFYIDIPLKEDGTTSYTSSLEANMQRNVHES